MSKKNITDGDIEELVKDFAAKNTVSVQSSKRKTRKKSPTIDGDDSTDDEAVTGGVEAYKLEESWKEFQGNLASYDYKKSIDQQDLKYSFILHAFGRGVYYSEPVNAIYESDSGLKQTYLKQDSQGIRKVLGQTKFPINHQNFESEIDYIANRRMTDRSEKRRERNGINLPKDRKTMPQTNWSFAEGSTKETKGVKKITNTSRDDWTLYLEEEIPYLQKASRNWVENLTTNLSELPQDDVEQMRAVLRGDKIGVDSQKSKKLAFLINLFFGSETSRSAVGFVSHQMFLDLIGSNQAGFRNWREAFEGGNFPQMGEGAINALRLINDDYNGAMPYNYRYDANRGFENDKVLKNSPISPQRQAQNSAKSIIAAEARIAKSWLALKFPDQPQIPETLMKVLPSQILEWYRGVDLSHFSPESIQEIKKDSKREELSPQKARNLNSDLANEENTQGDFDFFAEVGFFTENDVIDSYNSCIEQGVNIISQEKSERNINDDERFICLWMECEGNAELSFKPNFPESFAEIKKGEKLLAICSLQSVSTDHENYADVVTNFVNSHKDKGVKIIFSIHGDHHYKTLAINPNKKLYRYIDSMEDSADGVIKHEGLKQVLNDLGYSRFNCEYKKQQYSEDINKDTLGAISHNNECAFHSVYTTIRIAQSEDIGSCLDDMKRYGMKMLQVDCLTLTPEFARDELRPFYEGVFENLRKKIALRKNQDPEISSAPGTKVSSKEVKQLSGDKNEEKTSAEQNGSVRL